MEFYYCEYMIITLISLAKVRIETTLINLFLILVYMCTFFSVYYRFASGMLSKEFYVGWRIQI